MPTEISTPVGRLVWGNPMKERPKTYQDGAQKGQPVIKDGKPVTQWAFGVAFTKAEFQQHIWPAMAAEAAAGYPNGVPPRFSWKYHDGDGMDHNGQPFNNREGYAGCYVLTVTTEAFAPPVWKLENGQYRQLAENEIKTGDYIALGISFKVNVATGTNTPSLYVNPLGIELVGYGKEIQNGPDPMALFGGRQHQLPPGASATPIQGGGNVSPPGMPGQGQQPGQMPGQMPAQQPMQQPAPGQMPGQQPQYQQPAPGQMPPPAHDFVQNAGQQPAPGQMPGQQPQYQQPAPGQMPGQQPQYQQPAPGAMPGMMPGNR